MKRALHTGGHDSPCGIPYVSVQDSPVLTDPHKLVGLRLSESVLIRTREANTFLVSWIRNLVLVHLYASVHRPSG